MKWTRFKIIGPKPKPIKLPAQPSPEIFSALQSEASRAAKVRSKFGELPEYMGLSQKSIGQLATESYAIKAENRTFFGKLKKEIKSSRSRTASGIKSLRSQGKKIKPRSLKVAKSKGAMKAYGEATKQPESVFKRIMEKYTGRSKSSSFKKSVKMPSKEPYSLDTREVQYLKKVKRDWGY